MNVIELLEEDHARVQVLFEQVKANEDGHNTELFQQIAKEIEAHAHAEETIVYPFFEHNGDAELQRIVREGIQEHRQMKGFLRELESMADDPAVFNAKLKVLIEDVEHHVEEEEGEMFTLAEAQFDESVLEELGMRAEQAKNDVHRAGAAGS